MASILVEINTPTFTLKKGTTATSELIEINQLKIQPIEEGDCYRYLGIDKNISCNGMLNKKKQYLLTKTLLLLNTINKTKVVIKWNCQSPMPP